jgi:SAM-dependent methyltransferase
MDKSFFQEYYTLERSHWWFKARLKILENLVVKIILPKTKPQAGLRILNVGVATGATTQMLQKYGEVTSVEYDAFCCSFLLEKTGIAAINGSLTELPFANESFDLICAFDVIEHIENDKKAVEEIHRVLTKEGMYFITVPAFQLLWGKHDEVNHHMRRYKLPQLINMARNANLSIFYATYFNFWLFFPIAGVKMIMNLVPRKKKEDTSGSDFEMMKSSNMLNNLFYSIFLSESVFLNKKIKFPVGISILLLGSKGSDI